MAGRSLARIARLVTIGQERVPEAERKPDAHYPEQRPTRGARLEHCDRRVGGIVPHADVPVVLVLGFPVPIEIV